MLCMLVKLLITSSTLSSVREDRRDILLLPATPLHGMQAGFSITLHSINLPVEVEVAQAPLMQLGIAACTCWNAVTRLLELTSEARHQRLPDTGRQSRVARKCPLKAAILDHQLRELTYAAVLTSLLLLACSNGLKATLAGLLAGLLSDS